jgi:hypothetical protein
MTGTNVNNKPYRDTVSQLVKKGESVVPYLELHLKELQFTEEANKDFLRNPANNVELINWNKRELSYDVIAELRKMQSRKYSFLPVQQIQQMLNQMKEKIDSNEELKNLSYKVEPVQVSGGGTIERLGSGAGLGKAR